MKPARGWAALLSLACCAGAADAERERFVAPPSPAPAAAAAQQRSALTHLGPGDRIGDLLDHPALAGFARLLLPRSDVDVDRTGPAR